MPDLDDPRLFEPQCSSLKPVETVYKNQWFTVRNRGGYFTIEYDFPQVAVMPVVENHSIVIVRAKRPVLNDRCFELPAGGAKAGESPVQAAARELAEETGIEIRELGRFAKLPPISVSPNRNPNLAHIFQVHISMAEYEMRKEHDKEIECVELFSLDEIRRLICEGEIYISLPVAVLSRYLISLNK